MSPVLQRDVTTVGQLQRGTACRDWNRQTIVFLMHTWYPHLQYLLERLQESFARPIGFFVLSKVDRSHAWPPRNGLRVHPVVIPGFRLSVGSHEVNVNLRVGRHLSEAQPGLVITKGWGDPGYLLAQEIAKRQKIPLITFMCGRDRHTPSTLAQWLLRTLSTAAARHVIKQSRFVFVYGSRAKKDALALGAREENVVIIKLAVDEDHFDLAVHPVTEKEKTAGRIALGLDARPLFLCVSQLIPRKGIRDLLHAFRRLRRRRRDAQLLLIGNGPLKPLVREFAAQHAGCFAWLPSVPYAEIPRYYALADYFVLATHFDAWATVINEAHCAKLPIISSDAAQAVEDLVVPGESGLVYPAGDVDALVEAMEYAMDRPTHMRQMAEEGYRFIRSHWNLHESARIWAHHLEIAIREGPR